MHKPPVASAGLSILGREGTPGGPPLGERTTAAGSTTTRLRVVGKCALREGRQRERSAQVIPRRSRFGSLLLVDHRLSSLCHFATNEPSANVYLDGETTLYTIHLKNICFARPRRRDYVISKILLAGVYSAAITAAGIVFALVSPVFFGLRPAASPILSILQYAFWRWLPSWAVGLMALSLAALTRSSVLGITLSVLSGGGVIAELTALICQRFHWPALEQYLLGSLARSQPIPLPGPQQMAMILGCSIGWAAVYTIGSLLSMEKRDI